MRHNIDLNISSFVTIHSVFTLLIIRTLDVNEVGYALHINNYKMRACFSRDSFFARYSSRFDE